MSVNGVLGNALSGLLASQTALRNTSSNIANVNTPGYARVDTQFAPRAINGLGAGVDIATVRRVVSQFLDAAAYRAGAESRGAATRADMLDRLQSQYGAPDDAGSLFARLDSLFAQFGAASLDPTQTAARLSAIGETEALFAEFSRLSGEIRTLRAEADSRIGATVDRINALTSEIQEINEQITRIKPTGGDVTGLENQQSQLVDELSQYLDVRVQKDSGGGLIVRTGDGVELVGDVARTFEYQPAARGDLDTVYPAITLRNANGTTLNIERHLQSGELRALLDMRDAALPELAQSLSELAARSADALNQAHNDASAVPPPETLSGRNTGLLAGDALNFTGATAVAIVNADGTLARRVDIDFDAGTIAVDGGAPAAVPMATVGDFVTALDGALGGGSASFANGALEISAPAGAGVSILQDEANPSSRGGRGFSHFFGLNDLVESSRPGFFETGLTDADAHGFAAGDVLTFRVTGPNGSVRDIDVTVGGATLGDLRAAINDATTGIGAYGSVQFDGDGQLSLTGSNGADIRIIGDETSRGGTGLSFSQLFGVSDGAAGARAEAFAVADRIADDERQLALSRLDLSSGAVGDTVLYAGDNGGALLLQGMLNASRSFDAAGGLAAAQTSLADYGRRVAGEAGLRAAAADSARASADAVARQADAKRAELSGVNMDEELAAMTMYQQSYNASARLIQAAQEMTDVLLGMV